MKQFLQWQEIIYLITQEILGVGGFFSLLCKSQCKVGKFTCKGKGGLWKNESSSFHVADMAAGEPRNRSHPGLAGDQKHKVLTYSEREFSSSS